ncbi:MULTISPECIES: hypothetical protein [unclassified Mesorhizobium]|uniref:hypothetical protein n=1 Tax=unclassified Mesorhizobium TaxID=325217 RepID=UPI0012ECA1EC|nr:hypothetical protein [Mesorhizobium sp. LSHC412B00]
MPLTRDEAIEVRRLHYEEHRKDAHHAMQLNADYGKWLIASLLLVHGAAIAFLAQNDRLSKSVLPLVFWWHVTGLITALTCGFIVWINWSLHGRFHGSVSPQMIYDDTQWPDYDGPARWINRTHWLAIAMGLASAMCILGAAVTVYTRAI